MITGGPTDTTNTSSGGSMLTSILGALGIGAATAGGSALTKSAYDRLQRIGEQAVVGTTVKDPITGQDVVVPGSSQLAQQAIEMSQFQPFTVTTTTGGQFAATPSGVTMDLPISEQFIQDMLQGQAESALFTDPYGAAQRQQAAQQAFGLGGQFMGAAAQQPADIQALRQQYGGLASQAAMDVLTPTSAREASVFERIRATQRPEEERQRLALEERLAQQGRLGVRTAMFGGTPEQLAMAQAQEEAQNRAALAAIQQAQAERQQALGTAQTLGGMFGQQATLGGALQAQQAGLGQQYANLGSSLAAQREALDTARQQQMLQMLTGGQGLISGGQALQSAEQQMGIQALQAGYAPQAALLSALSPALNIASMSDVARRQQGEFGLETQMANINAELARRAGLASLYGGMFSGAMGLGSSLLGGVTDIITGFID